PLGRAWLAPWVGHGRPPGPGMVGPEDGLVEAGVAPHRCGGWAWHPGPGMAGPLGPEQLARAGGWCPCGTEPGACPWPGLAFPRASGPAPGRRQTLPQSKTAGRRTAPSRPALLPGTQARETGLNLQMLASRPPRRQPGRWPGAGRDRTARPEAPAEARSGGLAPP